MPYRTTPLISGEMYHIFNRSNASMKIFRNKRDFDRFIFTFRFYQNKYPPVKLSRFNQLSLSIRKEILNSLFIKRKYIVEIISYCIMPNHFHFILRQIEENGIVDFIRLVCNSYSHFFNIKNTTHGSVFSGRFKAVRIETEEQLQHVVRYIHLNPLTSYVVKDFHDLMNYKYSSLPEYLGINNFNICNNEIILSDFNSLDKYKDFLQNHSDYQKSLHIIKQQLFD